MAIIDSVKLPDNSTYDVVDDTSGYQKEILTTPITINGTQETTVEGALGGLNDYSDALKSAISHDNIVVNGWFTVNETNFTTGTITAIKNYISAWRGFRSSGSGDGAVATLDSNGLTFDATNAGGNTTFDQTFSIDKTKTYTLSILLQNGTIRTITGTPNDAYVILPLSDGLYAEFSKSILRIVVSPTYTVAIRAIMLEPGSISTLASAAEPNYTSELLRCQKADMAQIAYQNIDATARKAYSAGQYFFNADGELCRAKTAILSGATLTEGTNFEKRTVGEELESRTKFLTPTLLATISTYDASYTATQDCWAMVNKCKSPDTYDARVLINDVIVVATNTDNASAMIPLKKGQTLKTRDISTGQYFIMIFA